MPSGLAEHAESPGTPGVGRTPTASRGAGAGAGASRGAGPGPGPGAGGGASAGAGAGMGRGADASHRASAGHTTGAGRAVGGAGPKGEAIAQAALRLFLRDGYERTSVDAIAAEAGVSKRTIYNRYGDKENLFLSVLRETYATMMGTFRGLAEAHLREAEDADVQQALTALILQTARTMTTAPDRIALVRLILAEAPYFPALVRTETGPQTMHGIVATHLARLAGAWHLTITDPGEAAEHLIALTINQINNRTMFGVVPMSDVEIEQIITSGVAAFVRAYRAP
jgi:TetR/AcrR family transcriptional regulator, mexJK operon transcriptional repressor